MITDPFVAGREVQAHAEHAAARAQRRTSRAANELERALHHALVDRIGAELMGYWNDDELAKELGGHKTSPLLEVAAARFEIELGPRPAVAGDAEALLAKPRSVHFDAMAPFSIHHDVKREMHAASLGSDTIAIDGTIEPAWARAPAQSWMTDWSGAPTAFSTKARFFWSKGALYALFELENTGLHADTSKHRGRSRQALRAGLRRVFPLAGSQDRRSLRRDRARTLRTLPGSHGRPEKGRRVVVERSQDRDGAGRRRHGARSSRPVSRRPRSRRRSGAKLPFAMYRMEGTASMPVAPGFWHPRRSTKIPGTTRRASSWPSSTGSETRDERQKRITKRKRKANDPHHRPGVRPNANHPAHIHCIACGRHIDASEFDDRPPSAIWIRCDHGSTFLACIGCMTGAQARVDEHDRTGQPVKAASVWHPARPSLG